MYASRLHYFEITLIRPENICSGVTRYTIFFFLKPWISVDRDSVNCPKSYLISGSSNIDLTRDFPDYEEAGLGVLRSKVDSLFDSSAAFMEVASSFIDLAGAV